MNQHTLIQQTSLALQAMKQNAALRQQLSDHGFSPRQIRDGVQLLEASQEIITSGHEAARQLRKATLSLQQTRTYIHERYVQHLLIARQLFAQDPETSHALGLHQKRQQAEEHWLRQANVFYQQAPLHAEILQKHDISLSELEETRILVGQMRELWSLKRQLQSRIQNTARAERSTFLRLENWYRHLTEQARKALKNYPWHLEALGLTVIR